MGNNKKTPYNNNNNNILKYSKSLFFLLFFVYLSVPEIHLQKWCRFVPFENVNSDGDAYLATIKVDVLFLDLTSVKATRNDSHWRQKCTTFIGFVIALASTASASTENFHSIINAEQQGTSNTLTSEQKHSRSQFFFSFIFYCFFLSFFVCCYVLFAL